jgi:hypothetical protein
MLRIYVLSKFYCTKKWNKLILFIYCNLPLIMFYVSWYIYVINVYIKYFLGEIWNNTIILQILCSLIKVYVKFILKHIRININYLFINFKKMNNAILKDVTWENSRNLMKKRGKKVN